MYSTVVLLMLDISTAFDTIGYQILLLYLHGMYGIKSDFYAWFKPYFCLIKPNVLT